MQSRTLPISFKLQKSLNYVTNQGSRLVGPARKESGDRNTIHLFQFKMKCFCISAALLIYLWSSNSSIQISACSRWKTKSGFAGTCLWDLFSIGHVMEESSFEHVQTGAPDTLAKMTILLLSPRCSHFLVCVLNFLALPFPLGGNYISTQSFQAGNYSFSM